MHRKQCSLGAWHVFKAHPKLAFDLEQIPELTLRKGTLDDVCIALEDAGSGRAVDLRVNALRSLGAKFSTDYTLVTELLRGVAQVDRAMAVWISCICTRGLTLVTPKRVEAGRDAIEAAEGWLGASVSTEEVMRLTEICLAESRRYRPNTRIEASSLEACACASFAVYAKEENGSLARAVTTVGNSVWIAKTTSKKMLEKIGEELVGMPMRTR